MNVWTIDVESYFSSKEFTLKKLTTEAYVRDPRFEAHGWAVRHPDGKLEWVDRDAFKMPVWRDRLSVGATLCHHAAFDILVLTHHYGIKPAAILDTLSMARLLLGNHVSVSLDGIRKYFGMPMKTTPYTLFDGKHWSELDMRTRSAIAEGACDEVESIWTIFCRFMKGDY